MIKVLIGGDICPINSNEELFIKGKGESIFNCYADKIQNADLSIANLEAPLTNENHKANKSGANIKVLPKTINGIIKSGFNLLSAANNHIGDFGEQGITDTVNVCKENKIPIIGVGENVKCAGSPFLFLKEDKKIGILSFADHEFGMASHDTSGANPLDIINVTEAIENLKLKSDYIIVLLHEGKEYYNYPSPELQKICRYIIDRGVDIIVCQHSHVIGACEKYKKGNIFYGQGNLIFDYANRKSKEWLFGFFIELTILNGNIQVSLLPYKQKLPGIIPLSKKERIWFNEYITKLSKNVTNEDFINQNWEKFCLQYFDTYISILKGHNKYVRKFFQLFNIYNNLYSKKNMSTVLNIIRSRVHRETLKTVIENHLK